MGLVPGRWSPGFIIKLIERQLIKFGLITPGGGGSSTPILDAAEDHRLASWKMNDNDLSNGQEILDSKSGLNLTIDGTTFSKLSPGKNGDAITRGSGQNDDFKRATGLEPGTNDFSLIFWIKTTTAITVDRNLFTIGADHFIQFITGNKLRFIVLGADPVFKESIALPATVSDGSWHQFFVGRRTESGQTTYFMAMDGQEVYSAVDSNGNVNISGTFAIGDNAGGSNGLFIAYIDH